MASQAKQVFEIILVAYDGSPQSQRATDLAFSIAEAMQRGYLVGELRRLHEEYQPDAAKWGVLGHAAEFLVAQRGLRR
jgi:hypothetical protein